MAGLLAIVFKSNESHTRTYKIYVRKVEPNKVFAEPRRTENGRSEKSEGKSKRQKMINQGIR